MVPLGMAVRAGVHSLSDYWLDMGIAMASHSSCIRGSRGADDGVDVLPGDVSLDH